WTGGGFRDMSPRGIRMALLSEHVPATDKLARFVTVPAYQEAGGAVTRDLFSEDGGGAWLADRDLLRACRKPCRRPQQRLDLSRF
ncbi:hypothetical protein NQU49_26880, partial [Escherichia coli]|uniref:hypothetical protein n=1 Tax=Escherichia coli TaxID=562 RepID=UPI00211735D2